MSFWGVILLSMLLFPLRITAGFKMPFPMCVFLNTELPGPPSNIVISNISPRSATLKFRAGDDGKTSISKWIVEGQVSKEIQYDFPLSLIIYIVRQENRREGLFCRICLPCRGVSTCFIYFNPIILFTELLDILHFMAQLGTLLAL